jgi:PAS domain S-box-containing protein/putative nucleotidyltransferase with HDIG domain
MRAELREKIDTGLFFDLSPELQCVADEGGTLLRCNAAWGALLGRSAEACEGVRYTDLLHPEDVALVAAKVEQVFATGRPVSFRSRLRRGDDTFCWVDWRVGSPDGRTIYAVAQDMSEHVAVEQSLRASQNRLRESQRVARVGHYSFDVVKDLWTASSTLSDIFGIDESYRCDFAGWVGIVHPDDREMMRRYVVEDVLGEREPFDCEYRIVRIHDRAERWVHGMGTLTLGDDGNVTTMFGVIQDITQRKRAELSVLDSKVRLEGMVHGVAEAMGRIVEARDPYTQGHELGVARIGRAIGEEMGLADSQIEAIEMASLVHDIGKLGIPAEILSKPSQLSPAEFALIKEHPLTGFEILKDIDFPWPVAEIVLQHHERMDGSGYPRGLAGDDILVAARVVAVSDVIEAMASHRPYRPALGIELAIAEVRGNPHLFDRDVVSACGRLYDSGRLEI